MGSMDAPGSPFPIRTRRPCEFAELLTMTPHESCADGGAVRLMILSHPPTADQTPGGLGIPPPAGAGPYPLAMTDGPHRRTEPTASVPSPARSPALP